MCKCFSYFSQNLAPSLLSSKNFSSFARMAILPRCPRAAAALPKTFARCNTARAYPVLQRYNHLHFPISCPTKAWFSWMFESPTKMSRNVQPETSRRSLETLVVRARRSATTRIAPRWLRENRISHFFQAIFPAQAVCVNVCFRTGALYCRTVRWRFDSSGSRGSVLSEQKSLPCPGACIIGFND